MDDKMSAMRLAKKELRRSIRMKISSLSDETICSQSATVTNSILHSPEYQRAKSLSVYLSMPKGEISTCTIVKDALKAGKRVFVPYIHKGAQSTSETPSSVMDMVALHSLEDYQTLESDSWGIPTPSKASIGGRERCLDDFDVDSGLRHKAKGGGNVDMIIMPAIAFDRTCGRLGHGKGYYDFFLRRYKEKLAIGSNGNLMPFLIGLSLQEQLLAQDQEVPRDATDWLVNAVAVGDGSTIRL